MRLRQARIQVLPDETDQPFVYLLLTVVPLEVGGSHLGWAINFGLSLDQTVAFRRYLRLNFHIAPRAEIKAAWLVHNKGDIRKSGLRGDSTLLLGWVDLTPSRRPNWGP